MNKLNLPAREALFDMQVETDEPEDHCDRFRCLISLLYCECINDVLVNEGGVMMRKRVTRKFVIDVLRKWHAMPAV